MTDGRRLAGRALVAVALRLGASALAFALFVVLSRAWGPAALGEFATVFAVFALLQHAPLLGLHIALIRRVAADAAEAAAAGRAASGAALAVAVALLLAPVVGLAGFMYPRSMHSAFWLVGASLLPTAIIVVAEAVLMGRERLSVVMAANAGESLLRVVGGALVLLEGWGLTALWAAFVAARVVTMLCYLAHPLLRGAFRPHDVRPAVVREYLRESPPFLGVLALSGLLSRLDFLLLSGLATLAAVGVYGTAYKVYEVALLVPSLTAVVLFPVFTRLHAHDAAAPVALASRVARIFAIVGLPLAIAGGAVAEPVLGLLFGAEYSVAGAPALRLLIFAPLVAAFDQLLTTLLLAAEHQRADARVLATSVAVYSLLLVALVPTFGVVGAAAATLATAVVQIGVRVRIARRLSVRLPDFRQLARPAAAGVVMALTIVMLADFDLGPRVAVGVAVYAAALVATGSVRLADVRALRAPAAPSPEGRA